jgi:hypothetical protein
VPGLSTAALRPLPDLFTQGFGQQLSQLRARDKSVIKWEIVFLAGCCPVVGTRKT